MNNQVSPAKGVSAKQDLFCRLFGVAMVAHVVGNWHQPDIPTLTGSLLLGVGLMGVLLTIFPSKGLLLSSAGLVAASVVAEMPMLGNHWLLAGLAAVGILLSWGHAPSQLMSCRWLLLIFYGFAAFAKLNSAFFDPSTSCAVYYANESLQSWGLTLVPGDSSLAMITIWATVVVEISIVPLLTFRRTRYFGVLLGSAFHALISLDLNQHFYDFTAILIALFLLFMPDESTDRISMWIHNIPVAVRRGISVLWLLLAPGLVVVATIPNRSSAIFESLPFVLWIPFVVGWLGLLIRFRTTPDRLPWRMGWATCAVALVAILNGLSPYTEVKTAYGFNMYSNLATAQGSSNHFVVQRSFPLRRGYDRPIKIIATNDEGLMLYRDLGYLIAYPEFRRYLAARPETQVEYMRGNEYLRIQRAGNSEEFAQPGPWWWRVLPLRAIDIHPVVRCQAVFLPAL